MRYINLKIGRYLSGTHRLLVHVLISGPTFELVYILCLVSHLFFVWFLIPLVLLGAGHSRVWITGHSIVVWAGCGMASSDWASQLTLSHLPEVDWLSLSGMQWRQLVSWILGLAHSRKSSDLLVLHSSMQRRGPGELQSQASLTGGIQESAGSQVHEGHLPHQPASLPPHTLP